MSENATMMDTRKEQKWYKIIHRHILREVPVEVLKHPVHK